VKKDSVLGLLCTLPLFLAFFFACNRPRRIVATQDGATFDSDGTAHITRVIPVPSSVSPEAQKWLASLTQQSKSPETLEQRRAGTDEWRKRDSAEARRLYPVDVEETSVAGVRTDIITPLDTPQANRGRVLINLHFPGALGPSDPNHPADDAYVGNTNRKNPVLSPIFSDLRNWPPSLLMTSTRDLLLSDTVMFHLALLREGNDAQLVVFEALPHAFWYNFQLPETKQALEIMARFFDDKLGR